MKYNVVRWCAAPFFHFVLGRYKVYILFPESSNYLSRLCRLCLTLCWLLWKRLQLYVCVPEMKYLLNWHCLKSLLYWHGIMNMRTWWPLKRTSSLLCYAILWYSVLPYTILFLYFLCFWKHLSPTNASIGIIENRNRLSRSYLVHIPVFKEKLTILLHPFWHCWVHCKKWNTEVSQCAMEALGALWKSEFSF